MKQEREAPFGLRLPPELKMWVKMKARSEGRSMNNMMINIVRTAMEQDSSKR